MKLNYDTFTGRRSTFICLSAILILLFQGAWSFFGAKLLLPELSRVLTPNRLRAVLLLLPVLATVVLVAGSALVTERNRSFLEKMGLKPEKGYTFRSCVASFCLMILIVFGLGYGLTMLLKHFGVTPPEQSMVKLFREMKPMTFLAFGVITVVFVPIAEELTFRHILYRLFRVFLYRKEAIVAVSLLFALAHIPFATGTQIQWPMFVIPFIPIFVVGFFCQMEYERSRSVIPSILMHAGFNLSSLAVLAFSCFVA